MFAGNIRLPWITGSDCVSQSSNFSVVPSLTFHFTEGIIKKRHLEGVVFFFFYLKSLFSSLTAEWEKEEEESGKFCLYTSNPCFVLSPAKYVKK